MKKLILLLSLIGTFHLSQGQGSTTPDWANKKGAIGIGAATSLNSSMSTQGDYQYRANKFGVLLLGRYGITNNILGQIGLGFGQETVVNKTDNWDSKWLATGLAVNIGGQVNVQPAFSNHVDLGVVFGVNIFNGTGNFEVSGLPDQVDDVSKMLFNLGIRPEYHFSNFFSINSPVSFFIDINLLSVGTENIGGNEENIVQIFGVSETFGNAGFTFWFK